MQPRLRHTVIATAVCGLLALASLTAMTAPPAHAAGVTFRYSRGYSVQHGWLCYGWPSGAYHCTQHWRVSGGRYVSLNPTWVPSEGSAQTSHASVVSVHTSVHTSAYQVSYQATYRNTYPYGQCTFGAQALSPHENLSGLGNAKDWLWNAERRGLPTGYTPRVGATVYFAPGVQGASWLGHVAHIVEVASNGRDFLVQEMNYYGYGGGWGRYSFRWAHTGSGVAFIY